MAEPVPAGSDVSAGTYRCTQCGNELKAAELREAIGQGPEEATRDQRIRLGELIAKALEQRRERDGTEILEQLRDLVREAWSEPPEREWMVLNAALLVERDRIEELESGVEEVAQARGERMQFRLLGPMPAYHFLETEEAAPA